MSSHILNNNISSSSSSHHHHLQVDPRLITPPPLHQQQHHQWGPEIPPPRDNATSFSVVEGRDPRYNRSNMGSEKYRLKWSKYESNILSAFHSLLETEALSDVTLFCEGQTFKAHRLVLAACSTHFESLFSHAPVNAPSNNQLFVILDGTRADDLQILLQFMYRGEAYLHQDRINSVLRTAEVLQVKGLSEGPKNLEINEKNLGGVSGSAGPSLSSSASNARLWSPPPESSSHRSTVGIMGHMRPLLRKEPREPPRADLHRDLDGSPPHHLMRGGSHGHANRTMSPTPDHNLSQGNFAYPSSRSGGAVGPGPPPDSFGVYGNAFRGLPSFSGGTNNRDFSPGGVARDRSPPPERGGRSGSYGPSAPPPPQQPKVEREEPYGDHVHRGGGSGGSRSGSVGGPLDRGTPASDKTDRHTPASHHGGDDRDYDRRSNRNSPISPVATPSSLGKSTPASFASDSTTDLARASSSVTTFKDRLRRSSDSAAVGGGLGAAGDPETSSLGGGSTKFQDYRRDTDQMLRIASPSGGGRTSSDTRMPNEADEASSQAASNLEAFRRIAQAHAERERFLPGAAGVLHGGINAATIVAQGLTGSASDYMRLAMPVRDPDNGDAITGSGTKLRCPFCERTYGYETNLRAHIRQRHQGIRVSCPYCPRTFTRNNTVRRHVAREHRHLGDRIPTKFGSTRVMPDPIRFAHVTVASAQESVRTTSMTSSMPGNRAADDGNNVPSPTMASSSSAGPP